MRSDQKHAVEIECARMLRTSPPSLRKEHDAIESLRARVERVRCAGRWPGRQNIRRQIAPGWRGEEVPELRPIGASSDRTPNQPGNAVGDRNGLNHSNDVARVRVDSEIHPGCSETRRTIICLIN